MRTSSVILFFVLSAAAFGQAGPPRTVRDYFNLLPEKYFNFEGCDKSTDPDCSQARAAYLTTYVEVDDAANGYFKGGCDGAQACIQMALFRRPDSTYIVAVRTVQEIFDENYFLTYRNGKWTDVTATVVPQFSKRNEYELPRRGTTIKVYKKNVIENGDDYEVTGRGKKLYDLVWAGGKFTVKK